MFFEEEEKKENTENTNPSNQALDLLQTFNNLSEGLFFISESDFPAASYFWDIPGASGALSSPQVLNQLVLPLDTPVEEKTLEDFFRPQTRITEPDDPEQVAEVERFKALQASLEENLNNIKVFRVGEIQIQAYAVGETQFGGYAGILTTLIET